MTDLLPPPAVLRTPTWYGGPPDERALALPPGYYAIEHSKVQREGLPDDDRTTVTIKSSGEVVYAGIGPAEVVAPE